MKHRKNHRSVEVCIATDGSIKIEAHHFKGSDCEAATKFLEDALGMAGARQRKPEYHQRASVQSQQNVDAD